MSRLGLILLVAGVCAWAAYVFYGFLFLTPAPEKITTRQVAITVKAKKQPGPAKTKEHPRKPESTTKAVSTAPEHISLGGRLTLIDKWGHKRTIICPVVAGYWLALPYQACISSFSWNYTGPDGNNYSVIGGLWTEGEDMGLWRLAADKPLAGAPLAAWNPDIPISWRSLVSNTAVDNIDITLRWEQGYWLNCQTDRTADEPGVFIQDNKIVGWSFPSWLEGGYLWNRQGNLPDDVEITVADFYQQTFAGGREEQFARALSLAEREPVSARFAMLAAGFHLSKKLSPEETPPDLQSQVIIKRLFVLAEKLRESGMAGQLLSIFDPGLLREIMDMDLLMLMINIRFDSHDFTGASWLLRQARSWPWPDNELQRLAEADLQFYLFKLAETVNENDPESGWQLWNEARRKYADPELELFGVELALLEDDWQIAEELLTRQWPTELAGQVNNLAEQIAELKKLENKIIIRFTPGAKRIPVTARLNDTVNQNFLIDTGATTVTIPLHTAEDLGLEIDRQTPRHKVSTAGGEVMAWEVELDEIELGGWTVSGIKALILDIPDQADLGLLGLNFLNYFVVNLDSEEGVLLLEPK